MNIRPYRPTDYKQLVELYKDSTLYGGQFDENRDSEDRLQRRVQADSDAILVAEEDGKLIGTLSLIEDTRVAWLYRFAVKKDKAEAISQLCSMALTILKNRGHKQVLVYTPIDDS
jgi:hypothetical protein